MASVVMEVFPWATNPVGASSKIGVGHARRRQTDAASLLTPNPVLSSARLGRFAGGCRCRNESLTTAQEFIALPNTHARYA